MHYSNIFLELRPKMAVRMTPSLGRESNRGLSEYEAGVLITTLQPSVVSVSRLAWIVVVLQHVVLLTLGLLRSAVCGTTRNAEVLTRDLLFTVFEGRILLIVTIHR